MRKRPPRNAKLPDFVVGRNGEGRGRLGPKTYGTGLCMKLPTRQRIVAAAKRHHVATDLLLNVLVDFFDSMHMDWQAAMLRGEKVPPPPP